MNKKRRIWLLTIREKREMTQQEMAEIWGISRSLYSFIENGERNPSVNLAKKSGRLFAFDWTLFFELVDTLCVSDGQIFLSFTNFIDTF